MPFAHRTLEKLWRLEKEGKVKEVKALLKTEAEKEFERFKRAEIKRAKKRAFWDRQARLRKKRQEREERSREYQRKRQRKLEQELEKAAVALEQHNFLLYLIREKKVNITAKLMRGIKNPEWKQEIIKATCLSKV